MNNKNVLKVAGEVFHDLREVGRNLFKGTLQIDSKAAGIFYIDLNNKVLENFSEYQESILAKDFYSQPGDLQWNYYLFLLNEQISENQKIAIERDDKYARKFVLTANEFSDFFSEDVSDASIENTVVDEWKELLDSADLQEVYSEAGPSEIYRRFIKKSTVKGPVKNKKSDIPTPISFINKLILQPNYRKYPTVREFNFGKVNLIKGINGVGKTSLLEAIEFLVCGKTARNAKQQVEEAAISAIFNNEGTLTNYLPKSNIYSARDYHWYSTNPNRLNYLYNSFNRFNFFNTDAAYKFANSKDENDIKECLNSIILGPEYSTLRDKAERVLDLLKPVYNEQIILRKATSDELIKANQFISSYQESESLKFLYNTLSSDFESLQFQGKLELSDELFIVKAEDLNNQLLSSLMIFLDDFSRSPTKRDLMLAQSRIQQIRKRYDILAEKIRDKNVKTETNNKKLLKLTNEISLLEAAVIYLKDDRLLELGGLSERLKVSISQLAQVRFVKRALDAVDLEAPFPDLSFERFQEKQMEAILQLKAEKANLEVSINSYLDHFSHLESLLKQIKSLGQEYVKAAPSLNNCPLCNTVFERLTLEKKIQSEESQTNNDSTFDLIQSREEIRNKETKIALLEKELKDYEQILTAYRTYFEYSTANEPLNIVVRKLKELLASEKILSEENADLTNLEAYANELSRSEDELNDIKRRLLDIISNETNFDSFLLPKVVKMLTQADGKRNKLLQANEILKAEHLELESEVKKLFDLDLNEPEYTLNDTDELIMKMESSIAREQQAFKQIEVLCHLSNDMRIVDLYERSQKLAKTLNSYKEELRMQAIFEDTKARKISAEVILKEGKAKFERLKNAVTVLTSITKANVSAQLANFSDNFKEIFEIFKSIHVPREFKAVTFPNDVLTLITDNDETRTITQISTGQRSALALATFIYLNKKLHVGPNLVMFDDPIAFVDDLNALSFIDYLRMQILPANRQIFFATANNKLAALFTKKFNFLGKDDFKVWDLNRQNAEG